MKKLILVVVLSLSFLGAFGRGKVNNRDASATNIPVAFGSAGAGVLSSLSEKSNLAVINNTSSDIAISVDTTATNCADGVDNAIVPANGASVFEGMFVNQVVCVRSLSGSAITSGTVRTMVW